MKIIKKSDGKSYTLKTDPHRFLYPKEYMKFEDQLKSKQKFSVKFLINTGARIMEIQNVKVEDVDFNNYRIVLRVTKTKAAKKEKVGRMRTIPISKQFARYLKKYANDKKLLPSDYFGVLSNPALNIAYKKAGKLANIKNPEDVSSHTFRKTIETWLMALKVDGLALTAHFGHDMKTAAQHYVSPDVFSWEEKKQMREIIGDLYAR